MKTADIKQGAASWADAAVDSAVTVYYARQPDQDDDAESAPFPGRPALAIQLAGAGRIGEDKKIPPEKGTTNTATTFKGVRTQSVMYRAFGDDTIAARDIVESLRQGIERDTIRWTLRDHGLVVNQVQGTIDQGAVRGAKWENRAQMDIQFAYSVVYTDDPGVIEKVPFEGTIKDQEGNTVATPSETIDIS